MKVLLKTKQNKISLCCPLNHFLHSIDDLNISLDVPLAISKHELLNFFLNIFHFLCCLK